MDPLPHSPARLHELVWESEHLVPGSRERQAASAPKEPSRLLWVFRTILPCALGARALTDCHGAVSGESGADP